MLVVVHEPPRGTSPQLSPTQVAGAVHCTGVVTVGLQTFVQAFPSQRPGAQLTFAGVTQVPLPLHVEGGTYVDIPAQDAARHVVFTGCCAQRPPEHWPVLPQVLAAWTGQRLSAPDCTGEQVPRVAGRSQVWQAAVQALLQQNPCAQNPLEHSSATPQGCPRPFFPQDPAPVCPQTFGSTHWAFVLHDVKHWSTLQR